MDSCQFCRIALRQESAALIYEDTNVFALLDIRPLFRGHVLLMPRRHIERLEDVPAALLSYLFLQVQQLARAVEEGMKAQGTFIALNNKVSQSVAHLHIHIVPRRRGDGLKGFFWPRHRYESPQEIETTRQSIRTALGLPGKPPASSSL